MRQLGILITRNVLSESYYCKRIIVPLKSVCQAALLRYYKTHYTTQLGTSAEESIVKPNASNIRTLKN